MGDGNLTRVTLHPDGDVSHNRETEIFYDWRDRQMASYDGVSTTYQTFNNAGQITKSYVYESTGGEITYSDGVPQRPGQQRAVALDEQDGVRRSGPNFQELGFRGR